MPVRGEIVPGPGSFEIEVLDADPRRVKKAAHRAGRKARPARRARAARRGAMRPDAPCGRPSAAGASCDWIKQTAPRAIVGRRRRMARRHRRRSARRSERCAGIAARPCAHAVRAWLVGLDSVALIAP
ncbi:MAG: hypothetical protein MZV49_04375 [Rhodopseudomonas palustris]|nr:hypothetical protein [Rhodopseudomonas palustris]